MWKTLLRNLRYLELLDGLLPDLRAVSAVGVGRGEVPSKAKNDLIETQKLKLYFFRISHFAFSILGGKTKCWCRWSTYSTILPSAVPLRRTKSNAWRCWTISQRPTPPACTGREKKRCFRSIFEKLGDQRHGFTQNWGEGYKFIPLALVPTQRPGKKFPAASRQPPSPPQKKQVYFYRTFMNNYFFLKKHFPACGHTGTPLAAHIR